MLRKCMENVRKNSPLVHNITNYVTVNDVANVLLACGASPIMADDMEEVEEITSICGGLNINIGTLNRDTIPAMVLAGKKANMLGHKVLLDPVGIGASSLRTQTALMLMKEVSFDVIRGNASEIKTLSGGSGSTRGVDADIADAVTESDMDESVSFIKDFSRRCGSIIVMTGSTDLVTDGERCFAVRNGRKEMESITGTGCQLSALITAFITANPQNCIEAAASAVCAMGLAGEIAWNNMQPSDGNSAYRSRIIDAICNLDGEKLEKGAIYEIR